MSVADTEASKEAKILLEVALQFGSTLDLDRLLKLVIERVAELMTAERALCALFDDDGTPLKVVLHNMEWEGPGHPLPVSQGVIARVVAERAPVLVSDAVHDLKLRAHMSVQLLGLRLVVASPILSHSRVIGVLYVDSRLGGLAEVEARRDLLLALSRLVGTAVENAQLFAEQRYRAQLLAHFVHDFRSPLAVVTTNAGLLADELGAQAGEAGAMSRDVLASARRMLRMIDSTLELTRADLGARSPKPQRLDLAAAVRSHVSALEIVARQARLGLEVRAEEGLPAVETIPDRLSVVVDNLVFNALKYAAPRSTIAVEIASRADAGPAEAARRSSALEPSLFHRVPSLTPHADSGFVEVSIHNHGEPIPADLLDQVFQAFVRGGPVARGHRSTGLGLSIVEQCVQNLGGRVWVRSTAEEGTRISFTVPTKLA